jgi:hypothetical protein
VAQAAGRRSLDKLKSFSHRWSKALIRYTCNICGTNNAESNPLQIHRELLFCAHCGSNPRFRGVVNAFQKYVLDDTRLPLTLDPSDKNIRGIGMSDWSGYADHLARICSYQNTYYHTEPFLDVTKAESASNYTDLDFVISSDVLEHVVAPVTAALRNIWGMLKENGVLILTVPYLEGYETIEHFPHLNNFQILETDGKYSLVNNRADGEVEVHNNLVFHGGPGSTLELRIFGEGDLLGMLRYSGFSEVIDMTPTDSAIGYVWAAAVESQLARGRASKSHVLVCRK